MITHYSDPDLTQQLLSWQFKREAGEPVKVYLAEGDSWFSFGGATSNLLMALDTNDTLIVSCASPGDTMRNINTMGNSAFWRMLSPRFGAKWDGVLLSAGGNDLLGDVSRVLLGGNINRELLAMTVEDIAAGYRRIVRMVRDYSGCPVHAHTYDYPVSDPYGGWFRAGPWIGDKLLAYGVPYNRHDDIITDLIDALASKLHVIDGLTIHDTRGTLEPGVWRKIGWQKHYRNEIHPTVAGYRKLAAKWAL